MSSASRADVLRSDAAEAAERLATRVLPRIEVSGDAYRCGQAYGRAASALIDRTVAAYAELFAALAGVSWAECVEHASRHLGVSEAEVPDAVDQMRGIADGAGVALGDIFALNARTELLAWTRSSLPGECSAVATLGETDLGCVAAQNWDWLPFAQETVVALATDIDGEVPYVTVVEAGLLGKFGLNGAGLGVLTNGLAAAGDDERPGVPYHLVLQGLLTRPGRDAALDWLRTLPHSSSANYLLVDGVGATDLEAKPGTGTGAYRCDVAPRMPVIHTNHFLWGTEEERQASAAVAPSSLHRYGALENRAGDLAGAPLARIPNLLSDHSNWPASVCAHADASLPAQERWCTVASVVMAPAVPAMWVAAGNPCVSEYRRVAL